MIHHSVLIKEGRERFHTQRQQMSGLCHHGAETSVTRPQAEESHSHQKEGRPRPLELPLPTLDFDPVTLIWDIQPPDLRENKLPLL